MTLDVKVTCSCGRTMQPEFLRGRDAYRCGCGHTVEVHVPGRLVFQEELCCYVGKFGTCKQPAALKTSLCMRHIGVAVEAAVESPGELRRAAQEVQREARPAPSGPTDAAREAAALRAQIIRAGAVVYYLSIGECTIKIGTTTELSARMQALYVDGAQVLAAEPGGTQVEGARHMQFADLQVKHETRRELFTVDADLVEHIQRVRALCGSPFRLQTSLRKRELRKILPAYPELQPHYRKWLMHVASGVSVGN